MDEDQDADPNSGYMAKSVGSYFFFKDRCSAGAMILSPWVM